ncbi:hypothetical protein BGW80DRAFT_1454284 [Lactifluus volemus]|nr:hypothetical protein BGW80DRAFT_1454284 [Lactifluus volemus]
MAPRCLSHGESLTPYDISGSGESSADADTSAPTTGGQRRKRAYSDGPISAFSSSDLSSVDETVSPLISPQRRHTRQHEREPLPDSLQGRASDSSPLVWIRVTRSGRLASNERGDPESYWWPACVTEGQLNAGPLTISLYGEISSAAPRSIQLEAPSLSCIRSFKWPGQDIIRFSSATFRCSGSSPRQGASSKRSRTALDEAWRFAVDLALEADAVLNDGLPSNLSSYRVGTVRMHERKAEEPMGRVDTSTNSSKIPVRWSPPPCDPLLEIPGELVFSLERRGKTEYWAARIEEYIPPRTPSISPKYRVRFKDDTFCIVSRDMFYTLDEPEFHTCKLGRYVSDEEETDTDSDGESVPWETVAVDHVMPPPSPGGFCGLSIREQFAYVKPVIKAILNETYYPARDRHQAFMQGGSSRLRLRKAGTGKGDLTAREKGSCPSLGDLESESGLSTDLQVEQPPDSPASRNSISECKTSSLAYFSPASLSTDIEPCETMRQLGSPSYEALSEGDKLQYCLLVLFHEATLQLLLWRSGERRTPDLLSPDDEERLHLIALAKSEERTWVEEVLPSTSLPVGGPCDLGIHRLVVDSLALSLLSAIMVLSWRWCTVTTDLPGYQR